MIIKVISDTHNDHSELNIGSGDVLIHCGDASTKGNYTEGFNFLWWFVKQPFKYKILVCGNHDKKLKSHPGLIELANNMGIVVLVNDYIEIEGIKMYGVCKTFSDEASAKDKSTSGDRVNAWKDIPKGLDLLITHIPPKYVLDMSLHGNPCGCSKLTEKVKEVVPKFHVFGHIHEHGGEVINVWGTKFMNCSVKNRDYITVRDYTLIELNKK